jgi:hypothetical protein
MAILNEQEHLLVDTLLESLKKVSPEMLTYSLKWLSDMEQLEKTILSFPSLFEKPLSLPKTMTFAEQRSQLTLLDSLLIDRDGDKTLYLPARATLGKGFLVAKYHMFNLFVHTAHDIEMPETYIKSLKDMMNTLVFTLMAEDVYVNLLDDIAIPEVVRRQVALALIILWERRSDFIVNENHMSNLQAVWNVRKNLVPVFGTMMGVSELLLVSMNLDDMWSKFVSKKLSNPETRLAMEEFLMGLSFEQIRELRRILREQGISAVNRDEIASLLHEDIKVGANVDLDDFYMMYTIRRDNARARKRLHHNGPHNTLEDHYMAFVFEQYREKDFNGIDMLTK